MTRIALAKDKEEHDLLWTSSRAGFETPLTKNTLMNVLVGYLVFNDQAGEFNGVLFECFLRRRF